MLNVSTTVANNYTPTHTTPVPTTASMLTKALLTTKTIPDTTTEIQSTQASNNVSPVISMSAGDSRMRTGQNTITTTAEPPSIKPVDSYHHFDGLSFAGGALVAIVFVILGSMAWKMYLARIERSYWTL
ncbi:uncharacterized protein [Venturia canescens]|nr:uncharacterized protein LOC122413048 isoform X2 [Venturia canescens]